MSTEMNTRPDTTSYADLERAARALQAEYTRRAAARAWQRARVAFAALQARLAYWSDKRRTLAELREMDDRMLADIGLTRGDVAAGRLPAERLLVQQPQIAAVRRDFTVIDGTKAHANRNEDAPARAA